jgi:hypothetical protein
MKGVGTMLPLSHVLGAAVESFEINESQRGEGF